MHNSNNLETDDEISAQEIFAAIWASKIFIIFCIILSISTVSLYLRGADRKYTVSYKLIEVSGNNTQNVSSRYSNLASLAGIQMPSGSKSDFKIFKELLKSEEVSEKIFENKLLIRRLYSNEWNGELGKFLEPAKDNRSKFLNSIKRLLTGDDIKDYTPPNPRRLVELINKNIQVSEDKKTGMLNLTMQTTKPENAIELIVEISKASDNLMRDRYINFSKNPLIFYKQKLNSARSREHREALAQLITKEEQKLMLASSSKYFSAKPITKPSVSYGPTSPNFKNILILSVFVGFFVGAFIVFIRTFHRGNDL